MRGNEFIRGVMDFANAAAQDADSANFALGELIGGGFQSRQEPTPTADAQAQPDTRTVGNVEIPLRERQEGETSGRPRPEPTGLSGSSLAQPSQAPRQEAPPAPTNVRMLNQNATRRLPVNDTLAANIGNAIESVYGPGFEARIYSGGQPQQGKGPRVGSVRHDEGRAADLYVYGPDGERLRGDDLAPIAQFWKANRLGGVGLEMTGGGIHLDDWTEPPPGGGMSWSYGGLTAGQRAAIEAGARGELPVLAQEWAGMVVGEGNEVNASNLYNSLSDALTTTMSTGGQMGGDFGEPTVTAGGRSSAAGVSGPAGSMQVEELIGGMVRDIFGPEDGDTQRARAHKSSIWENLSVSLGQMAAGQPVNVSSVLRAQENSQQQIVVNRMEQHRMRAGAAAVLDSGGSPAMAQAVATGAMSFSDVLNERQISNAETQLARENMQDDTRRGAFQKALQAIGFPEELTNLDPRDIGSFVSLENMRQANEAAELAAMKEEDRKAGRQQIMESLFQSSSPEDQQTARAMALNPELSVAEAQRAWQEAAKRDTELAEQRRKAIAGDQEAARAEQERIATDRRIAELRQGMQDASEFEREVVRQYDLTGGTITASESEERAAEALDLDPTVVGNRLVSKRTGEVLVDGGEAAPATARIYNQAREQAAAQGPEALAAFDARFPTVADYDLVARGREGGLEESTLNRFVVDTTERPPESVGRDLDVSRAFGLSGVISNLENLGTELFTGQLADPDARAAAIELNRLATGGVIREAAEASPGRMSNYLLQLFEDFQNRPNQLLSGPETARLGFQDQLRAAEAAIEQNNILLSGGFARGTEEEAAESNARLQSARSELYRVLDAFDRAGIGEVTPRESSQTPQSFDRPEDVSEALEAGQISPGDVVVIDGQRFRVRAQND